MGSWPARWPARGEGKQVQWFERLPQTALNTALGRRVSQGNCERAVPRSAWEAARHPAVEMPTYVWDARQKAYVRAARPARAVEQLLFPGAGPNDWVPADARTLDYCLLDLEIAAPAPTAAVAAAPSPATAPSATAGAAPPSPAQYYYCDAGTCRVSATPPQDAFLYASDASCHENCFASGSFPLNFLEHAERKVPDNKSWTTPAGGQTPATAALMALAKASNRVYQGAPTAEADAERLATLIAHAAQTALAEPSTVNRTIDVLNSWRGSQIPPAAEHVRNLVWCNPELRTTLNNWLKTAPQGTPAELVATNLIRSYC